MLSGSNHGACDDHRHGHGDRCAEMLRKKAGGAQCPPAQVRLVQTQPQKNGDLMVI